MSASGVEHLRQLAQMYQVPRLELLCAQALQESVGPASAVPLLEAAHATGDGRLLAQCRRYVADNAAEVRASGGVEQLRDFGVAKGLLGDALDQVAELKGTVAAHEVARSNTDWAQFYELELEKQCAQRHRRSLAAHPRKQLPTLSPLTRRSEG